MIPSIRFLFSLQRFGMKFGLRNIRSLLHRIGDPQTKFKTIHIAGTNGKGSTSSMIAAILTSAGYRVGLYTSPHLVKFNERIRINGRMITDKEIDRYCRRIQPHAEKLQATFFETATAIAFRYFADAKVDIAVIETGLGGRLDSTNILRPLVSVITTIGKDHTEQLGTTLRSIAAEKAGIIKRRVPVVIGPITGTAGRMIKNTASLKRSVVIESSKLSLPPDTMIELKGEHQTANAKCAVGAINAVCRLLPIGNKAIRDGLKRTTQLTGIRARFELIKGTPDILLDVAHNPEGIRTLVAELKRLPYGQRTVIFGVMKDKDHRSILQQFKTISPTIIATQPVIDRSMPSEQLYALCKKMGLACFHAAGAREAVTLGREKTTKGGLLVITGSHYLVGEIIPLLEKKA